MSDMQSTIKLIKSNIGLRVKEENIRINNYKKEIRFYCKENDQVTLDHKADIETAIDNCENRIEAYENVLSIFN